MGATPSFPSDTASARSARAPLVFLRGPLRVFVASWSPFLRPCKTNPPRAPRASSTCVASCLRGFVPFKFFMFHVFRLPRTDRFGTRKGRGLDGVFYRQLAPPSPQLRPHNPFRKTTSRLVHHSASPCNMFRTPNHPPPRHNPHPFTTLRPKTPSQLPPRCCTARAPTLWIPRLLPNEPTALPFVLPSWPLVEQLRNEPNTAHRHPPLPASVPLPLLEHELRAIQPEEGTKTARKAHGSYTVFRPPGTATDCFLYRYVLWKKLFSHMPPASHAARLPPAPPLRRC
jgi:hypothetical protein